MKTQNLRRVAVNSLSVAIDGKAYHITSEAEISLRDEKFGIPNSLEEADTVAAAKENLAYYGLHLKSATP